MNFCKIVLINLFFWFGNTVLFACFCQSNGFCNVLTDSSHVVEAKVIAIYYPTSSNKYYIDIEITDYLYGSDTLSSDKLTIEDSQLDCDWLVFEDMVQLGDQLVFMFEKLSADQGANYPSFSLSNCYIQYLFIDEENITGLFLTESYPHKETIDYALFKESVIGICNDFPNTLSDPLNFDLTIYPNPAYETLKIKTNAIERGRYLIYSHNGKVIKSGQSFQRDEWDIDISDFSTGIYYLQIKIEGIVFNKKIIKI